jgi:class 3 adenylate cyclase
VRLPASRLELIILVPVAVFLLIAGAGSYYLILNSVDEFAERTVRQNLDSLAGGIYNIADKAVDELNRSGKSGDRKATRIRQVRTFIEIEDFARKNEIGVAIFVPNATDPLLAVGVPDGVVAKLISRLEPDTARVTLPDGTPQFVSRFTFSPWTWDILILTSAETYSLLIERARSFYILSGAVLAFLSIFMILFLRRTIARPIHSIVDRFRAGVAPDYRGIREFEFLSDSVAQMMQEVASHRELLEEEVRQRTAELQTAKEAAEDANRTLEGLSTQLSKYLSPQIYASIFSGQQTVEIASKRKKLTVFFSDIANFTETTERMESEDLTQVLNHYLTEMSSIALAHGATIDKYIGDAMLGFFGDPESRGVKEDALACVRMAMAMQERLQELYWVWRDQGIEHPFQMRIGVNTGFCTVGNFGSEDRMDYTIIGNEVNLAARLQAQADPGGILVAYETFSLVRDAVALEERGEVKVKGFSRPVRCYHVAGMLGDSGADGRVIQRYDQGVRIFLDTQRAEKGKLLATLKGICEQLDGSKE